LSAATHEEQEALLEVVRGSRPWTDLAAFGVAVRLDDGRRTLTNPRRLTTTASARDLAQGFAKLRHDPAALREWAFVVEAMDVELAVEGDPAGEMLLEALWDASFGNPIDSKRIDAIVRMVEEEGGS
jgi:hypothetical protein